MSSSIWTQCAGDSRLRALRVTAWRVVEAQHQVSTRKLVDTLDEQIMLEEMIDGAKPPDAIGARLHYLLSTPFRYPPLRHGSRFGARYERSLWYGSETQRTAFAEVAYYRLVFLEGTEADIDALVTDLTAFSVRMSSSRGVDLVTAPFDAFREVIASPVQYAESQALGAAMRAADAELFRYPSARDSGGVNVAAFTPAVFRGAKPRAFETWHAIASRERVEFVKRDHFGRVDFQFARGEFEVDGVLPTPALT